MTEPNNETAAYERDGYAILKGVAPSEVARGLLAVIRNDMVSRPETLQKLVSTPRVNKKPAYEFYGYRYPAVMGFHWGLTSRLCAATGARLVPTYAFFRVYQEGDVCTIHSDRPSCEHSLSLALGYADNIVWDFAIGSEKRALEAASQIPAADDFGEEQHRLLQLNPGDGVLYKGVNYRHGRLAPNPNRWSAHLFLHWVDADGPYKDWAFDRQKLPPAGDFPPPPAAPQPV